MNGKEEKGNVLDRLFSSIESRFGLEKPPGVTTIYRYPREGDPTLWIDLHEQKKEFKPWYYWSGSDKRVIPASNKRSVIHFFPPEAEAAYKRQTEEQPWFEDKEFKASNLVIIRRGVTAFADLLGKIKDGTLEGTEYLVGVTNNKMAESILALGFRRCWEEDYVPVDLNLPMNDENMEYKVGTSVSDLVKLYDLQNQEPTEELVKQKVREYIIASNQQKRG